MKLHQIFKDIKKSYCDELNELSEYEIQDLEKLEIDEAWYWYAEGFYKGDGCILMRKGNLWCIDSLSHCSCYGPTENVTFDGVSFSELLEKHSKRLMRDAGVLLVTVTNNRK